MKLQVLLVLLMVTLTPRVAYGGSISGIIRDTSDKPVREMLLGVVNIETSVEISTISNEKGEYLLKDVPPGVYNFVISLEGTNFGVGIVVMVGGDVTGKDVRIDREGLKKAIQQLRQDAPSI